MGGVEMKGANEIHRERTDGSTSRAARLWRSLPASLLVATATDLLAMHIQRRQLSDPMEFSDLCLSLARGIDYAVANNEVPVRARDLPLLLKQVYKRKNDFSLQAAVMVLMISVKNACKIGWFPDKDTDDLLTLAKEIGRNFCTTEDIHVEPSYALPYISKIMSRFYPQMKMGRILASLEVKPGYEAFVADFHIPKSMVPVQERICLFVAQTDNMDTSSSIMTPPQVNFLLNGKGVRGRISASMDNGPQLPTNVTVMLKCGINLLQAVGQFNGHYIIVIAFMSVISSFDALMLQDYVHSVVAAPDSDFEIIEGPSRISLNCPISYRRIKTPVKGHLCKHRQCFDFDNFMEMNLRRPSWRCPHCNQPVCYPDIRIDQNIVKVLREVGENVVDVIISADGSWKAALENRDRNDQTYGSTQRHQEGPEQCESIGFSNIPANVVDLTMGGGDDSDAMSIFGNEDRKPFKDNLQCFSTAGSLVQPEVNNTVAVDQNASDQIEDNFGSGILLSISSTSNCSAALATTSDVHMVHGISKAPPFSFMPSPVLTDAVSPAFNRESVNAHADTQLAISLLQNQSCDPNNLQLQQSGFGIPNASNEYGRLPSIPRNVSRTPIAIQAPPVQAQASISCQQTRTLDLMMPSAASSATSQITTSMAPNMDGFDAVNGGTEREQQFSRSVMNSSPVSDMASSSMQHREVIQNWDDNDRRYIPGQSVQHFVGLPAQSPGAYSSSGPPSVHQNSQHPDPLNLRTIQAFAQPQKLVHAAIPAQPEQVQPRGGGSQATNTVINKQALPRAAARQTTQMSRTPPSVPVQLQASRTALSLAMVAEWVRITGKQGQNMGGAALPVLRADGSAALASEQNWQPSGRMRGSLTGEAHSAALGQFIIKPTQPAQASQPPSDMISTLHGALQMRVPGSNSTNAHNISHAQTYPTSGDATNQPGSSSTLPEQSPGCTD